MISIIIVPLGLLLFYKQFYIVGDSVKDSVVSTVAAVLGMIPEGLVLLTSVALTLGALTLAKKKTLVQELYCIETLARVDTLCLDKTGTITEGTMCVERVDVYDPNWRESELAETVLEEDTAVLQKMKLWKKEFQKRDFREKSSGSFRDRKESEKKLGVSWEISWLF